jgi:hypothetical protein
MDEPAEALANAIEDALPGWVARCVEGAAARAGRSFDDDLRAAADEAGERARLEVGAAVRALLETDIDEQRTNPLSILRGAVRYPTEVLHDAGVPEAARRDDFVVAAFPGDVYDLTPATWADIDPSLQEPGITWGAWKAYTHLSRRRPDRGR